MSGRHGHVVGKVSPQAVLCTVIGTVHLRVLDLMGEGSLDVPQKHAQLVPMLSSDPGLTHQPSPVPQRAG
eukprot:m.119265 g.119265  ORF g.119265 m.119265 type:complete len:70 (-) comp17233_c0_seq13:285-494(-)